jgi:hypothetical protein
MNLKTKFCLFFLLQLASINVVNAQRHSYRVASHQGFFSIEETRNMVSADLLLSLQLCDCYTMELYGDKRILGTESFQDFTINRDKLIQKYKDKFDYYRYYDSSVCYEMETNNPMKVIFFFYKSIISGSIPTGKYAIDDGIYNLIIYKNELYETALTIAVKGNTITKL